MVPGILACSHLFSRGHLNRFFQPGKTPSAGTGMEEEEQGKELSFPWPSGT
jgi:hypothetical protein